MYKETWLEWGDSTRRDKTIFLLFPVEVFINVRMTALLHEFLTSANTSLFLSYDVIQPPFPVYCETSPAILSESHVFIVK